MSTNNVYYVDMKKRFEDYQDGKMDMRHLHPMVYDMKNVALAVRQLSKTKGRMAKGQDGTNYQTLENYSIAELSEIVKDRLLSKKMDYVRRTYIGTDETVPRNLVAVKSVAFKSIRRSATSFARLAFKHCFDYITSQCQITVDLTQLSEVAFFYPIRSNQV